ncbi:hypothetical protein A1Q1_06478 [Trichosporon asahii var. asahii CBS 2479]|uniref:Uncharacterized protein n=1 Tax=Trichosporon asahii var. asahii (strain ATCC 90039 / CBS 2479 / JCM 2466 / KCTC 7840 / NBRC 103889/ NCYC 2677 / UAMH 7654) TaxID=1186058 RepID=J5SDS9_TRIAS|nr:hypothetical protein A1Q1_06478 [Trichosporon asahii var. asahii CBS 2479]EJT45161.1 hypothetical protein A1Q1_06478 [Trichosporon asahii var. asahii CBS 2479]
MADPAPASATAENGAHLPPLEISTAPPDDARAATLSASSVSAPLVPSPACPASPAATTTSTPALPLGSQGHDESASGRRQEVEASVRAALLAGQNVIVDRVNFDPTQRGHFLAIAQQTGARPLSIVLKAPFDILRQRLLDRTDHPTLKDSETALKVLGRMRRELVYPQTYEGFQRVLFVDSEGDWTKERLVNTLEKLEREGTTGQKPRRGGYGGEYRGHGEIRGGGRGGYRGTFSGPRDVPPASRGGLGGFGGRGYQPAPRGGYRGGPAVDRGRVAYSRGGYQGDRPAGNATYRAPAGYDGSPRTGYRGNRDGELAFPISNHAAEVAWNGPTGSNISRYDAAGLPPRPPHPLSGSGAVSDSVPRE